MPGVFVFTTHGMTGEIFKINGHVFGWAHGYGHGA
jgi:hypothetical protein